MAKKKDTESTENTEKVENVTEDREQRQHYNCISALSGNKTMAKAAKMRPSKTLYPHLVFEGECVCLFSDTNVGKSIFAVQMGVSIADYHKKVVIYFDFELSMRQFYNRYSDEDKVFLFPETFYRAEIKPDSSTEFILQDIEATAVELKASVLIIDNLTWLCADAEDGAAAASFMMQIKKLQREHAWTIIVIAHTPKLAEGTPISVNNLAGSKHLSNFFDSMFSIGRCGFDKDGRYLKQVKIRAEKPTYDSDNVALYLVDKKDAMLQFIYAGTTMEAVALMDPVQRSIVEMIETLNMSDKELAEATGESTITIRKLRRYANTTNRMELTDNITDNKPETRQ